MGCVPGSGGERTSQARLTLPNTGTISEKTAAPTQKARREREVYPSYTHLVLTIALVLVLYLAIIFLKANNLFDLSPAFQTQDYNFIIKINVSIGNSK